MNTNLEKVLEKIPEFEEFINTAGKIRELAVKKIKLENKIKSKESEVFRRAVKEEEFFIDGKIPSATYIENAYKRDGLDGSITELRDELADVDAELEFRKNELGIYNSMLDVFRTISANERKVIG